MSWIHSSKAAVAVALLLFSFGAAGTAAALDVSASDVPSDAEVGSEVSATITIQDPYQDAPSEWDLRASTDLENVSWRVEESFQGDASGEVTAGGQTVEQTVPIEERGDLITIEVTGIVPAVGEGNYSYDPAQNFTFVELEQVTGNNAQTLDTWTVEHYTAQSREARTEIDSARQAIAEAGGVQEASDRLDQAISSYERGNFPNAISIANDAQQIAEESQQSQQTMQLLLYAAIGLVVVALVAGGVWYWRQQQDDTYKLQ